MNKDIYQNTAFYADPKKYLKSSDVIFVVFRQQFSENPVFVDRPLDEKIILWAIPGDPKKVINQMIILV